jgi:hypothetical protein
VVGKTGAQGLTPAIRGKRQVGIQRPRQIMTATLIFKKPLVASHFMQTPRDKREPLANSRRSLSCDTMNSAETM